MKNLLLIAVIAATGLMACKHGHHSHESASESTLKLNAGRRWSADEITRKTFTDIRKDLEAQPVNDTAAAKKFVESQEARIAALLKGCTMQGEAHEQLHTLIGKTNTALHALKEAKPDNLSATMTQLKATIALFPQYFD